MNTTISVEIFFDIVVSISKMPLIRSNLIEKDVVAQLRTEENENSQNRKISKAGEFSDKFDVQSRL